MACADCIKVDQFWDGEPAGTTITYEDTKAYVAKPQTTTQKGILFVPDIYGLDLRNNLLLADKYAQHGFSCVIPDYFGSSPPPLEELKKGNRVPLEEWLSKMGPDITVPLSQKFLRYLRSEGSSSVGVVGYCWGGRPAVLLAGTDEVKALVVNHGSFIQHEDVRAIKQPILLNGSDNDRHIPREKFDEFEQIVRETKIAHDFKFYVGIHHGWTVKGDTSNPETLQASKDAFDRGINWFKTHV